MTKFYTCNEYVKVVCNLDHLEWDANLNPMKITLVNRLRNLNIPAIRKELV